MLINFMAKANKRKNIAKPDDIDDIFEPSTDRLHMASALYCEKCGKEIVIKSGKYGKFLGCNGFPDCKFTKNYK